MFGMIFNRKEWHDQLMFVICLGQFVNGISVYGIDPVETCSYVLHAAISNNCVKVIAEQEQIENAVELWDNEWIENILVNGTNVCFDASSSSVDPGPGAPGPGNCAS
jgi:hypothetical protein